MIKRSILLTLLVSLVQFSPAQWSWVTFAPGVGTHGTAFDMVVDAQGNSYIVAEFDDTVNFGGTQLISNGGWDALVAKVDKDGNVIWVTSCGGTNNDRGRGIGRDANGNIYITGGFVGNITLGGINLSGGGNSSMYLAKLDSNGSFVWAVKATSDQNNIGNHLQVDSDGNCYVAGHYKGNASWGSINQSATTDDGFIAKYNSSGVEQWVSFSASTTHSRMHYIALNASETALYFVGYHEDTTLVGGVQLIAMGDFDAMVGKIDTSGTVTWAWDGGGTAQDRTDCVTLDGSGHLYVAGPNGGNGTYGSTTVTTSTRWMAKFDTLGNVIWVQGDSAAYRIAVRGDTTIYTHGSGGINAFDSSGAYQSTISGSGWYMYDVLIDGDGEMRTCGKMDNAVMPPFTIAALANSDFYINRTGTYSCSLGQPLSYVKNSDTVGNMPFSLAGNNYFSMRMVPAGDWDGDMITDMMVSAIGDSAGRGALYLLRMNANGTIKSHTKISGSVGGGPALDPTDYMGIGMDSIGDLNGDGILDFAAGAYQDDDGSTDAGAVYIFFMNAAGTADSVKKISNLSGGLSVTLDNADWFGISIAGLGDLDGDNTPDIAVAAHGDDNAQNDYGAVYILFMNPDGTVKSHNKIDGSMAKFDWPYKYLSRLGHSLANLGDLDGDGVVDLAITAIRDSSNGISTGSVTICFLDSAGNVKEWSRITSDEGNLGFSIDDQDFFGSGLALTEDLDGDGRKELFVAANGDDDGGTNRGAFYILYLNSNGTVRQAQKVSQLTGLPMTLQDGNYFANDFASLGDMDNDGFVEVAVGARIDDDGFNDAGAFYILDFCTDSSYMEPACENGRVFGESKVSSTVGDFGGALDDGDIFGRAGATIGDLDGDGVDDIAIGAQNDDDGGTDRGAIWILFMNADGTVKSEQKISDTQGNFTGTLADTDRFGASIAYLGFVDADTVPDIAVGVSGDNDGGTVTGSAYILFMNANGTVKSHQKISATQGNFSGGIGTGDAFGFDVEGLGDLDGDNIPDLAIGARRDDDGVTDAGAVYVIFLNANGTAKSHQKISIGNGGFTGPLSYEAYFGNGIANLGDVTGDGIVDIAVGAPSDSLQGVEQGTVWILALDTNGTIKSQQAINTGAGGFTGSLDKFDQFGYTVEGIADQDGDAIPDIAISAVGDDDAGQNRGAIYICFLNANGTLKSHTKISALEGGFDGVIHNGDQFGAMLCSYGDFDADGRYELISTSRYDDDGGTDRGAFWILDLCSEYCAAISDFTASNNVICEGDSVTFTNNSQFANSYTWIIDTTVVSNSEDFGYTFQSTGSYDVQLVANSNGCADTSSIQVVVWPNPNVNLGNDTAICVGDSVALNAGGGFIAYSWCSGGSAQIEFANTAGQYCVQVTSLDGCFGYDTLNVSNHPVPSVSLGNDTTICSDDTLTLDPGPGYINYNWCSGQNTQTIDVNIAGQYCIEVTDANNCRAKDTMQLAVNQAPAVNLGNDTTFCDGYQDTLDAGPGFIAYLWSTGATTQKITVGVSGCYYVIVTDSNGCTATDTICITVNPNPNVNLGPDTGFCAGNTVCLDAGNSGATFTWCHGATSQLICTSTPGLFCVTVTTPSGCSATDTINIIMYPAPQPNLGPDTAHCDSKALKLDAGFWTAYQWCGGQTTQSIPADSTAMYCVTVLDSNGCTGSDSINVTINPTPVIDLGPDTSFCSHDSLLLDATYPGATYQWCAGDTTPTKTVFVSGTYCVIASIGSCSDSDTVIVGINPQPFANFTHFSPSLLVVDFTDQSTGNPVAWSWDFGDVSTSSQQNPQHQYLASGWYYVCLTVTNADSCSDVFCDSVFVSDVGIDRGLNGAKLSVFPNPTSGTFTVEWSNHLNEEVEVELLDLTGRVLLQRRHNFVLDGPMHLEFPDVSSATYQLRIKSTSGEITRKIILQR